MLLHSVAKQKFNYQLREFFSFLVWIRRNTNDSSIVASRKYLEFLVYFWESLESRHDKKKLRSVTRMMIGKAHKFLSFGISFVFTVSSSQISSSLFLPQIPVELFFCLIILSYLIASLTFFYKCNTFAFLSETEKLLVSVFVIVSW